jgi:hypothetical protein
MRFINYIPATPIQSGSTSLDFEHVACFASISRMLGLSGLYDLLSIIHQYVPTFARHFNIRSGVDNSGTNLTPDYTSNVAA